MLVFFLLNLFPPPLIQLFQAAAAPKSLFDTSDAAGASEERSAGRGDCAKDVNTHERLGDLGGHPGVRQGVVAGRTPDVRLSGGRFWQSVEAEVVQEVGEGRHSPCLSDEPGAQV